MLNGQLLLCHQGDRQVLDGKQAVKRTLFRLLGYRALVRVPSLNRALVPMVFTNKNTTCVSWELLMEKEHFFSQVPCSFPRDKCVCLTF